MRRYSVPRECTAPHPIDAKHSPLPSLPLEGEVCRTEASALTLGDIALLRRKIGFFATGTRECERELELNLRLHK